VLVGITAHSMPGVATVECRWLNYCRIGVDD